MKSLDEVFRGMAEHLVERMETDRDGPWAVAGFRWEEFVEALGRTPARGEIRVWPSARQSVPSGRREGGLTIHAGEGRFPDDATAGLGAAVLLWIDRSPADFQETASAAWRRLKEGGVLAGLGLVPELPIPLRRILRAALEPTGLRLKSRSLPSAFDEAEALRALLARAGFPLPRAWTETCEVIYRDAETARRDLRRAGTGDLEAAIRSDEGRARYRESLDRELERQTAEGELKVRWRVTAFVGEKAKENS